MTDKNVITLNPPSPLPDAGDEQAIKVAEAVISGFVNEAAKEPGLFTSMIDVDHAIASYLLSVNGQNRPLRPRRAMRYRSDMTLGNFPPNGETVKINRTGKLIDGQHRMHAIVGTSLVVPMLFVFGVTDEAARTVDQGAARNAGDYLQMRGEQHAPMAARIVKLRLAYDANEGEALRDVARPTNAQVLDYFEHHRDDVLASATLADGLREHVQPLVTPSVLGFVHNVLHDIEPSEADRYIEEVAKGEQIKEGDPAFAVRSRLLKMGRSGAARKAEILFTGWNAFHTHRPLKSVRVSGRLPALAR